MTLKVISQGHSLFAGLFKCNPSHICAAFYQISTLPDFNCQRARAVPQRQLGFLSFITGQVSFTCNILLRSQLWYSLPLLINDIRKQWYQLPNFTLLPLAQRKMVLNLVTLERRKAELNCYVKMDRPAIKPVANNHPMPYCYINMQHSVLEHSYAASLHCMISLAGSARQAVKYTKLISCMTFVR